MSATFYLISVSAGVFRASVRLTHQIRTVYRLILGDLVSTEVIYCVLPASHWGILESWPVEHVCMYGLSSFPRHTPSGWPSKAGVFKAA